MKISLVGGWEWRAQSLDSIAEATKKMLLAMPDVPAGRWMTPRKDGRDYVYDALDDINNTVELAERIERTTSDAAGGKRPKPGYDVVLYRLDSAQEFAVECRIRAGLEGPRGVRNHILVRLAIPDLDPATAGRLVKDHMAALIRAWKPDHLSAHTYEFMKAQSWDSTKRQISVGWDTYLSETIPIELASLAGSGVVHVTGDGGHYLTLSGTPDDPSLADAHSVRAALGYE